MDISFFGRDQNAIPALWMNVTLQALTGSADGSLFGGKNCGWNTWGKAVVNLEIIG